ncbi:MAG: ABC transporter permease [Acidobacteriota bacterium]
MSQPRSNARLALRDIVDGILGVHLWAMLAWQDTRLRYRRSVLGPFWLTINTAILVTAMGPFYGMLFHQDFSSYLSYVAVSFVLWALMSGLIVESCDTFVSMESLIKDIKLPLTLHVMRMIARNCIIFAHNALIIVAVLAIFSRQWSMYSLLFPLGLLVILANSLWIGLLLGLLCARFRDLGQIVNSLVQVMLFISPVIWRAEMTGNRRWLVEINPVTHLLEIVRAPLFGNAPTLRNWAVAAGLALAGSVVTFVVFARFRARVAYWL